MHPSPEVLAALAQQTGIPIQKFQIALGIAAVDESLMQQIAAATTLEQAEKAYHRAHSGSEAQRAALRKMVELFSAQQAVPA